MYTVLSKKLYLIIIMNHFFKDCQEHEHADSVYILEDLWHSINKIFHLQTDNKY